MQWVYDPAASRADPRPGVEGNTRLTASTGLVLTVLLLIEGFTILDVRGYLTLHTILGLALIGPVALKSASTIYRFGQYYRGRQAYLDRGPPPLLLRLIGPLVVASSVAVIGTGIALLGAHGRSDTWLTLHQASFIVWLVLTGVHFLAHIYQAVRASARDLRGGPTGLGVRGRYLRLLAVVTSLAVGLALAAVFTPNASYWQLRDHGGRTGISQRP